MARPSAQPHKEARASFGSRTDIGCVREHNEDSLVVAPPLYAVADGMGGHAAGEVASEIAVHTLADLAPQTADTAALAQAVVSCNYAVINAARSKGRAGMGTTLTAAVLSGERLAIAQVGDSRVYLLHQGKMQQLTRDHSLMAEMIEAGELTEEEARFHPQRSVITRALGSDPDMEPDLYELNVSAGDRLLLCSDGLSTMIDDAQISQILQRTRDPQRCANILVNEAIAAGGHDNITVVVVDVEGNAAKREKRTRRKSRIWAALITALLVAVVAGIGYGGYALSQQTAYLTAGENGKVVVYRGVPDTMLGINLSTFDHETDINVDDLSPGVANRLREGTIQVDNLEAADALIEDYRAEIAADQEEERQKAESRRQATARAVEQALEQEARAQEEATAASTTDTVAYTDPTANAATGSYALADYQAGAGGMAGAYGIYADGTYPADGTYAAAYGAYPADATYGTTYDATYGTAYTGADATYADPAQTGSGQ